MSAKPPLRCSSSDGGLTNDRMIGCRVTTLKKIERIQKAATKASFCINGMLATAMVIVARVMMTPEMTPEATAGS